MPESKSRRKKKARRGPTPPKNPAKQVHRKAPSPPWYVATMFALMAGGTLLVLARYIFSMSNIWLLVGLALISVGFLMTTNYR